MHGAVSLRCERSISVPLPHACQAHFACVCCHQEGRRQVQAVLPVAVAGVMATLRGVPGMTARDKDGLAYINVQVLQFSSWKRAVLVWKHIDRFSLQTCSVWRVLPRHTSAMPLKVSDTEHYFEMHGIATQRSAKAILTGGGHCCQLAGYTWLH